MGSPGHAFIGHTKALSPAPQTKDGGYGPPPHPLVLRPGQRFWPRTATRRELLVIRKCDEKRATLSRVGDTSLAAVRASVPRLLQTRADGQGRHYQFHGFVPRRYSTFAYVWSISGAQAVLCLPEWHPRRPVRFPARLVPEPARWQGAWLHLTCNLAASSAARLAPSDLALAMEQNQLASLAVPQVAR